MKSRFRYSVLCSVVLLGLMTTVSAQGAAAKKDPLNGTWQLNLAKSTMPGASASSSEHIVFRITGNEESYESRVVNAHDHLRENTGYKATYGGPATPLVEIYVAPDGTVHHINLSMVKVAKINERTRERQVVTLAGKLGLLSRRQLSQDGKTLTTSLLDSTGKAYQVRVFDRVG